MQSMVDQLIIDTNLYTNKWDIYRESRSYSMTIIMLHDTQLSNTHIIKPLLERMCIQVIKLNKNAIIRVDIINRIFFK